MEYLDGVVQGDVTAILTTRGDIIYRDATVPARLAKGADNTILAMGANDPEWKTPATILGDLTGANLDVGAYDVRGATLTADGLTSGRVVFAGASGLLSDDGDFAFSVDTLTVTKIAAFTLDGNLNVNSKYLTVVRGITGKTDDQLGIYAKRRSVGDGLTIFTTGVGAGYTDTIRIAIKGGAAEAEMALTNLNVTGLKLGGALDANSNAITNHAQAIADNAILTVDHVTPVSGDYARFTANGLEGREKSEVLGDLNVADGADVTGSNAPQAHKASHQDTGGDEISVTALSGLLADDQHVLDSEVIAAAIDKTIQTTKGDLVVATGASTPARLGVGADDKVLVADSGAAGGVAWADPIPKATDWKGSFSFTTGYGTTETDISALFSTNLALTTRRKYSVKLDLTTVETDGNFTELYLAVKEKIDGTNYRAIDRKTITKANIGTLAEPGIIIDIPATSENVQITIQMVVGLAANRDIYYAVVKEHLE